MEALKSAQKRAGSWAGLCVASYLLLSGDCSLSELKRASKCPLFVLRQGLDDLEQRGYVRIDGKSIRVTPKLATLIPPSSSLPVGEEEGGEVLVPKDSVIALYHQHLPNNPKVREFSPAALRNLRARCDGDPKRTDPHWWGRLFTYIAEYCPFLTGQEFDPSRGPFRPTLAWMLQPENFAKILNGEYDKRKRA